MNAERKIFGLRTAAATAALGTALLFAVSGYAADQTPGQNPPVGQSQEQPAAPATQDNAAQGTQDNSSAAASKMAKHHGKMKTMSRADRVEQRIKSLHAQLKITQAEEPQWDAVAQVMRDNANSVGSLVEQRKAQAGQMTAVDDLKSYEAITDAHADGLKKLIPAFEQLYNTMSDDQKKTADTIFRRVRRPGTPHMHKG
jgi:hypothetical protein